MLMLYIPNLHHVRLDTASESEACTRVRLLPPSLSIDTHLNISPFFPLRRPLPQTLFVMRPNTCEVMYGTVRFVSCSQLCSQKDVKTFLSTAVNRNTKIFR